MSKAPKDLVKEGERCKLRGRQPIGTVRKIHPSNWTYVDWDAGFKAPLVCHLHELEPAPMALG